MEPVSAQEFEARPDMTMWMVCFSDCGPVWWRFITRRGFRHCFAITKDHRWGVWIVYEWSRHGVDLYLADTDQIEAILSGIYERGGEVWWMYRRTGTKRLVRGPATCVTAVKHLLGLDSLAVTPWQLRCALRDRGAQRIVSP